MDNSKQVSSVYDKIAALYAEDSSRPSEYLEELFLNIFSFDEIENLLNSSGFSILKRYKRETRAKEELDFIKLFLIARSKGR